VDRRKRNKLCIWLIFLGVINVTAYTAVYACIGGDAINGYISETGEYVLRGHFIRGTRGGEAPCSRGVWFYSYFHSLSIIPTCVAMMWGRARIINGTRIATHVGMIDREWK
jgi:hypothetical protein